MQNRVIHLSNGVVEYVFLALGRFWDINDNNYFELPITLKNTHRFLCSK
jgi:hypothetical protein